MIIRNQIMYRMLLIQTAMPKMAKIPRLQNQRLKLIKRLSLMSFLMKVEVLRLVGLQVMPTLACMYTLV